MPKLIAHIGTHKTGTTAIQSFLAANADVLEEHGIGFPVFDVRWPELVNPKRNGYFLNRAALHRLKVETDSPDRQQAIDCAARLSDQVRKGAGNAILLSDERIWYSGALHASYWKALRGVAENIGFDEFEVILYLRRQDLFVESLWNQFVKATQMTQSLTDYLGSKHVRLLCDYYAGVKRIEEVFGRESLRIAVYDRSTLKNGDAVDDFCHRLGLPLDLPFERPADELDNPRLNNNLVELKRMMNCSAEYRKVNNVLGRGFAHAMAADDWSEASEILQPEERDAFLSRFKKGNKLLSKEYFGGKDLFRAPRDDGRPTWEFDAEAMIRDLAVVTADMLAHYELRIRALEAHAGQLERDLDRARDELSRERAVRRGPGKAWPVSEDALSAPC